MLRDILFYVFIVTSLINVVHFGFYIVGANLFDLHRAYRDIRRARHPRQASQPLVSIVIPAYNEAAGILRTLDSVMRNTYKRYEVIVVNDGSKDQTASLVTGYIKKRGAAREATYLARRSGDLAYVKRSIMLPKSSVPVRLVNQQNLGKAHAVNNGMRNHAAGSLLMTLDGDSRLHERAIEHAVGYFDDERVAGVAANVRVVESRSILGLLQKFEHMIGYRSKKFYSLTNSEIIVGGVASTYRRSILEKVGFYDTDTQTEDIGLSMKIINRLGNRNQRIVYGSDVLAYTQGVQSYGALFKQRYRWKLGMMQNLFKYRSILASSDKRYSKMLAYYRMPMAFLSEIMLLIEPVLLLYIVYLAATTASPFALFGSYVTITLYILWNLWPDEHLNTTEKARQSLAAPFMYFVFYIMNAVQIVAALRCIIGYKKVLGRVRVGSTWASPERAALTSAQS